MLIHIRGLKIHAKSGKGGVVNLVVSAQDKHRSVLGRFRQYVAHALFRAGDLCHPGHHHGPMRVVRAVVPPNPVDDHLANGRDLHTGEVIPLHITGGDTYYNAFFVHEGVKRHQQSALLTLWHRIWRQKTTDHPHFVALSSVDFEKQFTGDTTVLPPQ